MPSLNWTKARDDGRMRRQGSQVHEDLLPKHPQKTNSSVNLTSASSRRFTAERDVLDHLIRQLLKEETNPRLNRNIDPKLKRQISAEQSPYEWAKKHPEYRKRYQKYRNRYQKYRNRYQKISRQMKGDPQSTEEEKLELVLARLNKEKDQLKVKIENLNKELQQLNGQIKDLSDTK